MNVPSAFLFVGYLVQEPYFRTDRFPGKRLATISRSVHEDFDAISYEMIGGYPNLTLFLPSPPAGGIPPGWVLNGYAIDAGAVKPERGLDGTTMFPSKYEYAKHIRRGKDGLSLLGYDLVDESCHPMSLLHNLDIPAEVIEAKGGPLNEWGLFPSPEAAARYGTYLEEHNQSEPVMWQVWGDAAA